MKNGIIYNIVSTLIVICYKLNLVEIVKSIVKRLTKNPNKKMENIQITIDLFILSKFSVVIFFWYFKFSSIVALIIIWYLIATNLFTYFYYHVWIPPFQDNNESKKRRFINLFLSFIFSNLCFAVLYSEFYFDEFDLQEGHYKELSSLLYSSLNSLAASYDFLKIKTDFGYIISLIQLSSTFIFISIILSLSIPQLKRD